MCRYCAVMSWSVLEVDGTRLTVTSAGMIPVAATLKVRFSSSVYSFYIDLVTGVG